jgi:formate/nitrite transporter FocA (FNT family)
VSGRSPQDIWQDGVAEGERRLKRSATGLAATGFAGGVEIFVGIVAMVVTTAAFTPSLGEQGAHVVGSLAFGIGFVLITVSRAELFTENFLIPVSAVHDRRTRVRALPRMWLITLVLNLVGLTLAAALFSVNGVLRPESLETAGTLAATFAERAWLPAFLSAVAAGTVMTLFTWVIAAAEDAIARVVLALLVGFVLGVPSLNHAVVSFGELVFALLAGTAPFGVGDLARNFALAVAGNLVGGVGIVFATRLAQVRGEPGMEDRAPVAAPVRRAGDGAPEGDGAPAGDGAPEDDGAEPVERGRDDGASGDGAGPGGVAPEPAAAAPAARG